MGETIRKRLHQGQPVLVAGPPLERSPGAVVLIHGRGATARGMLELAAQLRLEGLHLLAPQAERGTWYPQRFLAPLEDNEPYLSSALEALGEVFERLEARGVGRQRVLLLGFSQGACLSLEFAARNAARYGGLVGLSGALIGPPNSPRHDTGGLAGTPVFLGCSDDDPHVPLTSVQESARTLTALAGEVTLRIYPGLGHSINEDEAELVRKMAVQLGT